MSRSDPTRGRPGQPRADWPAHRPPRPPRDDGQAPLAAPATPRSIHEEDTLDAARFVRPQQPPAPPVSDPEAGQPAVGAVPPGQPAWPGPQQGAGYRQQPPPGWPAPPPGQPASENPPLQSPQPRAGALAGLLCDGRRWWVIGGAAAVVVAVIVALAVATVGDNSSSPDATATTSAMVPAGPRTTTAGTTPNAAPAPAPPPTTAAPPPPPVVDAAALPALLLPADVINQRMNTTGMTGKPPLNELLPGSVDPPHCVGAWGPAFEATYDGSGYTASAVQGFFRAPMQLVQAVVAFSDAGAAKAFYDRQVADWNACKSTHIRYELNGVTEADLATPAVNGDVMTLMLVPTTSQTAGQQCERDMAVRSNVIVDVRACSPTVGSAGLSVAREIADKVNRAP